MSFNSTEIENLEIENFKNLSNNFKSNQTTNKKPRHTHIGNVPIGNGVFLAPMEEVSNLPFRLVCKKLGADIVYSEFIASEGIVRDSRKSIHKMQIHPEERPTAIQIFGADIDAMVESAKIVEDAGADILDINFGCWVQKVVRREAGAAFLKQPERMAELTNMVVNAVKIPVTVKTRLGWDKKSIVIDKVAKLIEDAGAKALAIHCRTRDMGMSATADWSWIPIIKDLIDIPVILNGDVVTPQDVKRAFDTTNCDALMIGRACIGYPFIYKQAKEYLETGIVPEDPGIRERIDVCLYHLDKTIEYNGQHGLVEFRKHYSGYLKGFYDASSVRRKIMSCTKFDEVRDLLEEYYDYLAANDRLEPVTKEREIQNLNCENPKFIEKQTREVVC